VRVVTSAPRSPADAATQAAGGILHGLTTTFGPPYPDERFDTPLTDEAAARAALVALLAEFRPDVIDIWGMEFASQPLVAWLLTGPTPVHLTLEDVWLAHGYISDPLAGLTEVAATLDVSPPASIAPLLNLRAVPLDLTHTGVTFVSNALRAHYAAAGIDPPCSRVRMAGVNLAPFAEVSPPSPGPPFVLLSVGQLLPNRGQLDLLRAADLLAHRRLDGPPLIVRIVGGGSPIFEAELREFAARTQSRSLRFEFTGPVAPERIAAVYAGAHLFVHTSHLPEGLPRVLMEAIAAGVPVIATDAGGQRDILDHGRWGRLVPPRQPAALADAIGAALTDFPRTAAIARAARTYAQTHFDLDRYAAEHAAHLESLALLHRPAAPLVAPSPSPDELHDFGRRLAYACAARTGAGVGDPDFAWRLGVVLKRLARLREAERVLTTLAEQHGDDPVHLRRAAFHLGELHALRGRFDTARRWFDHCLRVAPQHAKALYDLTWLDQTLIPPHLRGLAAAQTARQRKTRRADPAGRIPFRSESAPPRGPAPRV
jgi:glycosyltransferase involved in cell wall biosynthesis